MSYHVFHRTWWKPNPAWPDGREPGAGPKHTIDDSVDTEEEARAMCKEWNRSHKPGHLSDKAEFEEN